MGVGTWTSINYKFYLRFHHYLPPEYLEEDERCWLFYNVIIETVVIIAFPLSFHAIINVGIVTIVITITVLPQ